MNTMLTIHKDAFDAIGMSGTLHKSKILNCLFWQSNNTVPDLLLQMFLDTNERSDDSRPNVTRSLLDKLDKQTVWNCLSVPSVEEDGCEYCTMKPVEMQLFPKHQIYTNGRLTCPVLLTLESAKNLNVRQTNSFKKDNKKGSFKGAK